MTAVFRASKAPRLADTEIRGALPEGVAFSILLMNAFTPLIDRYTKTKPFGFVRENKK